MLERASNSNNFYEVGSSRESLFRASVPHDYASGFVVRERAGKSHTERTTRPQRATPRPGKCECTSTQCLISQEHAGPSNSDPPQASKAFFGYSKANVVLQKALSIYM